METAAAVPHPQVNPVRTILDMAGAYAVPRCLHTVADLGVADVLEEAPKSAEELAKVLKVNADALRRVLRLLSANGVFAEQGETFTHNEASRLLRSDHPHSLRSFVRMFGLRAFWDTQGALQSSVRTGKVAAEEVLPGGYYRYLENDAEASAIFNSAMAAKAKGQIAGVLAAYDFSVFRNIGDIGGGRGHLLQAILNAAPNLNGVLFDLPRVIQEISPPIASERLRVQSGSFLTDPLPTCDCYILMEVVHAFADADALAILGAVRKSAATGASLLVIEQMISDGPGPDWVKTLDIHMLALLGGRQRNRREYVALLNNAGFAFRREVDTRAGVAILEAVLS